MSARVQDHVIQPGKLYINGRFVNAQDGKIRPTINPATEEVITNVADGSEADAELAIAAARQSFDVGPWRRMSGHQRQRTMTRIALLIEKYADELAYRETIDMGKAIAFSRQIDAPLCADIFHYYAGIASNLEGASRHVAPPPDHKPKLVSVMREPLGVVAAITPFNFPLLLSATKIAPAIAAGNSVVHKPASSTPLAALKLAEVFAEAGLPEGVYNMVTGPGSKVGDTLVKSSRVNKIGFTGSTEVGQQIIRSSAETVKKVTMELGGKSANIVFADADLDKATADAFFAVFYNKGEICTAGSRLIVERSIHDEFVARLVAFTKNIKMGDPLDTEVLFGPLSDKTQFEKVASYVKVGLEQGAKLALGGSPFTPEASNGKGYFFEPTILTGVDNGMRVAQEEIFGPVLSVIPFDTEEEAIRIANGTQFGLASAVQTCDLKKAYRVAMAMQAGTCWVNCYNIYDVSVPFGGFKASGFGRECGPEALESYTHTKSIWVDLS
jgi:acyl-CoA reductase-like NAD-dependent aldehyde dehydrogenase